MFKSMRNQLGSLVIALAFGCLSVQIMVCKSVSAQTTSDRKAEADYLFKLGERQSENKQFKEAMQSWQKALDIYRSLGNIREESKTLQLLLGIKFLFSDLGQEKKILEMQEELFSVFKRLRAKDCSMNSSSIECMESHEGQVQALSSLSMTYETFHQDLFSNRETTIRNCSNSQRSYCHQKMIDFYLQALASYRESAVRDCNSEFQSAYCISSLQEEANALFEIGNKYGDLNEIHKSIEFYQLSIDAFKRLNVIVCSKEVKSQDCKDAGKSEFMLLNNLGMVLNSLGDAYESLGQFQKAIEVYQQSLALSRESGARWTEGSALMRLSNVYKILGQFKKAFDFNQQYLAIDRENFESLKNDQYMQRAIKISEQSLAIASQKTISTCTSDPKSSVCLKSRQDEGIALLELSSIYYGIAQQQKATNLIKQALVS